MNDQMNRDHNGCNRRDFLKLGAVAGLGSALGGIGSGGCASLPKTGSAQMPQHRPVETVRIGFVGVGGQGTNHISNLLKIDGVEIRAVCDIVEKKVVNVQQMVEKAGQPKPAGYSRGETDYQRMCEEEDLDLVYTATPWKWHVPICVRAMKTGKHAATEVPAAVTIDGCWELVETAEKTGKHCVMMENCCYGRSEMMVFNMVRKGLLGELIHGEVGYLHDLRAVKFSSGGEGIWRLAHSIKRDGNLYSTHGLGPVAQCMDINRGDRFDYLVSISSKSRGLNLYAAKHFGPDDPRAKQKYALGDINVTLIRTVNGLTITVYHDCSSPRPYSRINLVQGTNGIFMGYPDRIYIEGRSPERDTWETTEKYFDEFNHPLWKTLGQQAKSAGHGGMDYMEDYRMIKCLRTGAPMDMDVYDAAAWSVVSELSERSVARRGRSMNVPDFTRGKWKTNPPLGIVAA
ncbi:MAG: Gfo/Idh/MocA family oxidoreductase [Planctomycetota bacterium]|nr:MAG: Gfo/Idh/MocA family oxidoreductase [Planctomycetota bacterium]